MFALGCFGPDAKAAVPVLVELIRANGLKQHPAHALIRIGERSDLTLPVLIGEFIARGCRHRVGMGSFAVNPDVDDYLIRIGDPTIDALIEVLNGPNREMRVCAAALLARFGPSARRAIPSLIRAIEHPDAGREAQILRRYAASTLGRIGPAARSAAPLLNRMLDEDAGSLASKPSYDFEVVMALDRMGAPPVRRLADRFRREGHGFLAFQLAWLGPKAREAIPTLSGALTDGRPEVRIYAAIALAHIDATNTKAVPVLIEGLRQRDLARWGGDVPGALARLGPIAKVALSAMIALVLDGDADPAVLEAIVQIDPDGEKCVPALVAPLKQEDDPLAETALACLDLLGPRAADAVPTLAALLARAESGVNRTSSECRGDFAQDRSKINNCYSSVDPCPEVPRRRGQ